MTAKQSKELQSKATTGAAFAGKTLAFIGSGQMAEAMIGGLVHHKILSPDQIFASGPRPERGAQLHERYGIQQTTDNREAASNADIIVLSVKPQVIDEILPANPSGVEQKDLIVSIAAGVTIEHLYHRLGNPHIVRAMPNTPAKIGQGITVWTATPNVGDREREQAQAILTALGEEIFMEKEDYLDMATALSGTGPAYVFMFLEAMIDAGVHMGFSRRVARQLVLQTTLGSVEYARQSDDHIAALRNQVTSPGGTSAEALYQMEKGGFRTVISRAIWAAYQRSVALGGGKKVSERIDGSNS
jgi:pyrroline-5-carboxylate reductase